MATKIEYRQLANTVRASRRSDDGSGPEITGYASLFLQPIELNGMFEDFTELVLPGCFTNTIASGDCRALWNHDPNYLLGRVSAGTLKLSQDSRGLHFRIQMPDTQAGRDVLTSVERRDCQGASIGFSVIKQNWIDQKQSDGTTKTIRELTEVELFDCGPVTFPAAEKTSVEAQRSMLWPSGLPDEVRARTSRSAKQAMEFRMKAVLASLGSSQHRQDDEVEPNLYDCTCPCAGCISNNCDECSCDGCESTECNTDECSCAEQNARSLYRPAKGRTILPPDYIPVWERSRIEAEKQQRWLAREAARNSR